MKLKALLNISLLSLSVLVGSANAATLGEDFVFTPPEYPREVGGQVFQYFLPPADGFAANVNLQIQPYEGTLADYEALSREQFEQYGMDLVDISESEGELLFEYTGAMQGVEYHWYQRVLKDGNYFYLITATALHDRWTTEQDELIESVHSFTLNR